MCLYFVTSYWLVSCNVNMGYKSIINLNSIQSLLLFGRNHILCNWNVIENYLLILANLHLVRRCATIKWKRKRLLPGSKTLNSFKSQIYFAMFSFPKYWKFLPVAIVSYFALILCRIFPVRTTYTNTTTSTRKYVRKVYKSIFIRDQILALLPYKISTLLTSSS